MFVVTKSNGIYFGAQVNPSETPDFREQEIETEALETAAPNNIQRRLAFHNEYRTWKDLASITSNSSDPEIAGDIAYGRVPVIALSCADNITLDQNHNPQNLVEINSGSADADLAQIKSALSNLVYPTTGKPYPIMLRWFWEFNLNAVPATWNANNNGGCFVGSDSSQYYSQFKNAWSRIWEKLGNGGGTPNITFVWNPTVAIAFDDNTNAVDPVKFYPGNSVVDWIGVDGYSKVPAGGTTPLMFNDLFAGFFNEFANSNYNKPIMIAETGSCREYPHPYDQASYISDAENQLVTTPAYVQNAFGFEYFDGHSAYLYQKTQCHWEFGSSGLEAFASMGGDGHFAPMVTPAP